MISTKKSGDIPKRREAIDVSRITVICYLLQEQVEYLRKIYGAETLYYYTEEDRESIKSDLEKAKLELTFPSIYLSELDRELLQDRIERLMEMLKPIHDPKQAKILTPKMDMKRRQQPKANWHYQLLEPSNAEEIRLGSRFLFTELDSDFTSVPMILVDTIVDGQTMIGECQAIMIDTDLGQAVLNMPYGTSFQYLTLGRIIQGSVQKLTDHKRYIHQKRSGLL